MRRILTILVAITAMWLTADAESRYLELVEQADKAIGESDWWQAEQLLTEAMQAEPANTGNIMLLSNLGMIRYYMGRDSLALATLDDAHRIAPRSTAILANRATVLTSMGRVAEAIADYDAIIEADPAATEARYKRGLLRLRLADIDGAEADMTAIDSIAPGSREAETGMAVLLTTSGKFAEAAVRYSHVLQSDPQPEFYAARAFCYLMTDRLTEASDDIASGLALDPADGELYLYRAILNKMRYRPDDAEADARRALEFGVDPRRVAALIDSNKKRKH